MPKSKNFKAYNQALAIGFQAKKNLGQLDFSVGGKSRFRKVIEKSVKFAQKSPETGPKL